jgi:hypothetical protein
MAQRYVACYIIIKHYQNKLFHCQFSKIQLIYKRKLQTNVQVKY